MILQSLQNFADECVRSLGLMFAIANFSKSLTSPPLQGSYAGG
ncbi:hypothetical protein [Scytonema hofmannii]|nr:hypothetical protein [Scytonema hofmannii]